MFYESIIWNIGDRWRDILLPIPRSLVAIGQISSPVGKIVEQC